MEGGSTITVAELLSSEANFFALAKPKKDFTSEEILASKCCDKMCNLFITRADILKCRHQYVQFSARSGTGKEESRQLFFQSLKRVVEGKCHLVPIVSNASICFMLISWIFGVSMETLMNALTEHESLRAPFREMYKKKIDEYADVLYGLSKNVQQNSLGQIMLEPNYSKRVLGEYSKTVNVSDVRKTMGLKIRERKCDTLTRCSCCVYLGEKMMDGLTETDKKEASRMYKNHMQIIKFLPNNSKFAYNFFSQQRIITETISRLSRDQEEDILHLAYDAMSNKSSKLPIMNNMKGRPKCIPDSDQIPLTVTTVQVSQQHGSSQYTNICYLLLGGVFKHSSSYNVSLLIDSLLKLHSLPSKMVLSADSCPNNKSFVVLASLGILLMRVKKLHQIRLLFGLVGHTHNHVDANFGNISTVLKKENVMDPSEFAKVVRNMSSVASVEMAPTIYNFETLNDFVHKPTHLLSNNQIIFSKDSNGQIVWSASQTMSSSELFCFEGEEDSFPLFKDTFDPSSFTPLIEAPIRDHVQVKIDHLLKSASPFFTATNRDEYEKCFNNYGTEAFRNVIRLLNEKPSKVDVDQQQDYDVKHNTVLNYLASKGINPGKRPKRPILTKEMRKK